MNAEQDRYKNEQERVGIIGCGWLGKALVTALVQEKYQVVATTQHTENLSVIHELGAQAELLSLPMNQVNNSVPTVFRCQTLIICIPPGIRKGKKDYPDHIAAIIKQAESCHVGKVILISSTAVYEGIDGDITESAKLNNNIEKVKLLSQAEQHVLDFSNQGVVIRAAGLVGPKRHPAIFFKNNRVLTSPKAYVNLVHQADMVGQILLMIKNDSIQGVFNAVSETHVTKKYFYTVAAKAFNVAPPRFDTQTEVAESRRKVLSDKIRNTLGYQYQYDDLIAWLINTEQDKKLNDG
ncbi:NAD(P)-binding domain-containing protein [Thalassotalea sp. SU-HH00458]|uniref:NAD(P)-binding domain-containing protein n=1 Tax=Thalassotalea sp. SU-HH00458 TaxID=3127657 RepID=UPI0031028F48